MDTLQMVSSVLAKRQQTFGSVGSIHPITKLGPQSTNPIAGQLGLGTSNQSITELGPLSTSVCHRVWVQNYRVMQTK